MSQPNDGNSNDEPIRHLEARVSWLESIVFAQFATLTICFWWVLPAMFVLLIVLLPVLVFVHRLHPDCCSMGRSDAVPNCRLVWPVTQLG